jgi:3-oxoacyl-(acyl-carrier-protein) synthase
MKAYLRSASCISPQKTFNHNGFLDDIIDITGTRLAAIEPDYKDFIDPKLIRRMSHVIKMGVAAASNCLKLANVDMPGAVISGSAFGCVQDTVTFLTRIIEQHEELLPPTAFIQSTHNTVSAQIALMLQCHNYNGTFVHKGISFESALIDALMLLNEQEADNILVGGIDEMVETNFKILTRLGMYKRHPISNLSLFDETSRGSIAGEGAAFFVLTDKKAPGTLAELTGVKILYKAEAIADGISAFLASHSLSIDDIDLVITGRNGDIRNDEIYSGLNESLFKNSTLANYKHLCGEYSTSSSFALWLAANIVSRGEVPLIVREKKDTASIKPKKVLIYNHYHGKYHSLMLVSAV